MKKHQFKLEAVLKLKKFAEEKCRTELGILNNELSKIENQISHDDENINEYFNVQSKILLSGTTARKISFYPSLVDGKSFNIELLKKEKIKKEDEIHKKRKELALLRGELKVIENLKIKDLERYKKEMNKKQDEKIEEQTRNWLESLKDEGI